MIGPRTFFLAVLPVVYIVVTLAGLGWHRRRRRRAAALMREREQMGPFCRKCGYPLRGLNYPRCPECGTLRGFEVPLEQLDLTGEERELIDRKCRGRGDST
ncbi:MAG: hypothetical protein HY718_17015 [Planctomycetes bacterium]|nr:hypothetical protein [Planctomycetota bacterium]